MADTEVDARAALQAFFAAVQPRTPNGSSVPCTPSGQSGFSDGVSLGQRLKNDMKRVLQPSSVLQQRKDIEGRFEKLLEQVSPAVKFKPPARSRSKNNNTVDTASQTVACLNPPKEDIPEPPVVPHAPDPDEGKPRQRCCIIVENHELADSLRQQVAEERQRLFELDSQTTALTRELKHLRMSHWGHRRTSCHKEQQIEEHFVALGVTINININTNGSDHDHHAAHRAEKEVLAKKREELLLAKQEAKRWSKQARRLDAELQQQFRGGGDVQRILLRHPSGEVFLPPMGSGGDSDDGSDDDGDRMRMGDRRGVALASSDEDEEFTGGGRPLGGGGEPPKPPSPQWRSVNANRDEEFDDDTPRASEASSVTSPSGESGGNPTPTGAASRSRPTGGLLVKKTDSDSESSDDDKAKSKKPWTAGPTTTTVPPLPGLSGPDGAAKASAAPKVGLRSAADADDVEEVSSEEIYSQDGDDETSQSV